MAEIKIDISDIVDVAIDKLIEAGWRPSEWIPCSERMPEQLQTVIVCTDIKTVTVAWINGDGWNFADTGNGYIERWGFDDVLFWMPLPEPPKEGAGE